MEKQQTKQKILNSTKKPATSAGSFENLSQFWIQLAPNLFSVKLAFDRIFVSTLSAYAVEKLTEPFSDLRLLGLETGNIQSITK